MDAFAEFMKFQRERCPMKKKGVEGHYIARVCAKCLPDYLEKLRDRIRDLEQGIQSIKIRCEEGDPRVDWKPNFIATAEALLGS